MQAAEILTTRVAPILSWLTLAVSIVYMLDAPWRLWRNRPGRWGPLHGELLPIVFVLLAMVGGRDAGIRVLAAVFFCTGAALRLFARKRFGIAPWSARGG